MGKFSQSSSRAQRRLKVEEFPTVVLPIAKQVRGEFKSDYPSHISSHTPLRNRQASKLDNFMFRLEWHQRADGTKPLGAEYKYQDLKMVCPALLMRYLAKFIVLS